MVPYISRKDYRLFGARHIAFCTTSVVDGSCVNPVYFHCDCLNILSQTDYNYI